MYERYAVILRTPKDDVLIWQDNDPNEKGKFWFAGGGANFLPCILQSYQAAYVKLKEIEEEQSLRDNSFLKQGKLVVKNILVD